MIAQLLLTKKICKIWLSQQLHIKERRHQRCTFTWVKIINNIWQHYVEKHEFWKAKRFIAALTKGILPPAPWIEGLLSEVSLYFLLILKFKILLIPPPHVAVLKNYILYLSNINKIYYILFKHVGCHSAQALYTLSSLPLANHFGESFTATLFHYACCWNAVCQD